MKPIKFNLSYGNDQIKSFEGLKENCNVDMLLETLDNGLLVRWLTAQGLKELAEKVSKIDKKIKRESIIELVKILFGKDASVYEQAAAEIFDIREREASRLEKLKKIAGNEKEIISQYHKGYNDTIETIKSNANDYPALKARMAVLYTQYRELLKLDKDHFYEMFKDFPLVILSVMANLELRNCLKYDCESIYKEIRPQLDTDKALKKIADNLINGEKTEAVLIENKDQLENFKKTYSEKTVGRIYKSNGSFYYNGESNSEDFKVSNYFVPSEVFRVTHIKTFSGKTDDYWKSLEPKGNLFMIISIGKNIKVRNAGTKGKELTANDINGKFVFTDGIDYMSDNDSDKLVYMEV